VAITAVKATKATSATGTSVTMTSLAATAGNALLVGGSGYENGITTGVLSVTRSGDTFTTDTQGNTSAATDLQRIGIASAPNVTAGPTNLVTTVSSANGVIAFALEVSGLPTSAILDATSPAIKIATSTTATSNSLTNVTADAIYVTYCGTESAGAAVTLTVGGGWTETVGATTMKETNANSFPAGGMSYQIVASAAARNGAYTVGNADWGMLIAVYKMAGGAADDFPAGRLPAFRAVVRRIA
jgi:hypothetical protein